jgi:hypothetical protein
MDDKEWQLEKGECADQHTYASVTLNALCSVYLICQHMQFATRHQAAICVIG